MSAQSQWQLRGRSGLRAGHAIGLSLLVHALVLSAIAALRPADPGSSPTHPVELVPSLALEPRRAPAPPPTPPPRAAALPRRVPSARSVRRLERSNPSPAAESLPGGIPALFASADEPRVGESGEGHAPSGPPSAGPGSAAAAPSPPPSPPIAEVPPSPIESPPPAYPAAARRRRAEGLVLVRARVGPAGRVMETRVSQSSGADDLDRAALEAVRGWRFRPGTRGSAAVESWVKVPVRFRLGPAR